MCILDFRKRVNLISVFQVIYNFVVAGNKWNLKNYPCCFCFYLIKSVCWATVSCNATILSSIQLTMSNGLAFTFIRRSSSAAEIFVLYNFPRLIPNSEGRAFGKTFLGTMLTKSCLPEHELGAYEFFDRPSKDPASVHSNTERTIW